MDKNQQDIVDEILKLGGEKRDAYLRLDELETELMAGGAVVAMLRGIFGLTFSQKYRAKREELANTVRTIEILRRRMDELKASISLEGHSEAYKQIDHLWNYENTTSLSQQREARRRGQ